MTENNLNPVRNSPLMGLGMYVTATVLAIIGLVILPNVSGKIIAGGLFLAFGLAHRFLYLPADAIPKLVFYFVLQTLIIISLLWVFTGAEVINLLFFVLGVQATLVFPTRVAVVWLALFYLISGVSSFISHGANSTVGILFDAAVFFFTGVFGYTLREVELGRRRNQQLLEELRGAQTQLNEFAITQERNRLARDLHDSVKQQIFATSMQLAATRASMDANPVAAHAHLDEAERLVQQAQQELNALIYELRPIGLGDQGLGAALREYVNAWSRQSNIPTELQVQGERALPQVAEQALFRVTQEALANVARHSGATAVQIQLDCDPARVLLTISDNGRGFQASPDSKGIGLNSMRERMRAVGGWLQVESAPAPGTRVRAMVPTRTTP